MLFIKFITLYSSLFPSIFISTPRTKKSTASGAGHAHLKILDAERHDSDVKSD